MGFKNSLESLYPPGADVPPGTTVSVRHRQVCRRSAAYAETTEPVIFAEQVSREKERIYAPVRTEWKELHAGIGRAMQYFAANI